MELGEIKARLKTLVANMGGLSTGSLHFSLSLFIQH